MSRMKGRTSLSSCCRLFPSFNRTLISPPQMNTRWREWRRWSTWEEMKTEWTHVTRRTWWDTLDSPSSTHRLGPFLTVRHANVLVFEPKVDFQASHIHTYSLLLIHTRKRDASYAGSNNSSACMECEGLISWLVWPRSTKPVLWNSEEIAALLPEQFFTLPNK